MFFFLNIKFDKFYQQELVCLFFLFFVFSKSIKVGFFFKRWKNNIFVFCFSWFLLIFFFFFFYNFEKRNLQIFFHLFNSFKKQFLRLNGEWYRVGRQSLLSNLYHFKNNFPQKTTNTFTPKMTIFFGEGGKLFFWERLNFELENFYSRET